MKKIAILVEQQYQNQELWYPYYRLTEWGAKVDIVGPKAEETYPSKYGYPATSTKGIDKVKAADYDAVIIPGGYAPDHLRRNQSMVDFVKEMGESGKVVAAICHAGWLIASADIIKNKTVTCFYAIKDDVINAGANYVDQEVVVDGNIITARKPDDLPAFLREIIKALS